MKTVLKLLLVTGLIGVFLTVGCAPPKRKAHRHKPRPHLRWRWHSSVDTGNPAAFLKSSLPYEGPAGVSLDNKA